MWIVVAEIIAAIAGFGVAAELTSIGTDRIEPLMGQGMTGGVVLGLLGALPETIFVIIATLSMSYQIALGSALGGNIILFTLGIGIVGLVYSYKWKASVVMKEDYRVELYFLLASTAILAAVIMYGAIDRMSGAVLFMAYFVYLAYRYARAHKRMAFHAGTERGRRIYINGGTYLLAGAVIVVAISGMFVNAISELSGSVGVSALWLALFISPLAADLGENISAVRIAMRNRGGGVHRDSELHRQQAAEQHHASGHHRLIGSAERLHRRRTHGAGRGDNRESAYCCRDAAWEAHPERERHAHNRVRSHNCTDVLLMNLPGDLVRRVSSVKRWKSTEFLLDAEQVPEETYYSGAPPAVYAWGFFFGKPGLRYVVPCQAAYRR